MVHNKTIWKLSLASSGISETSGSYIAKLLIENATLRILDLGFSKMTEPLNICPNLLGNLGIQKICEGLK